MTRVHERTAGSIFGLAFGDALGKPTEFCALPEIFRRFGPDGPSELPEPALVTDDTQMALAVGEGLAEVLGTGDEGTQGALTAAALAPVWTRRFVAWAGSPETPGWPDSRPETRWAEGGPRHDVP